MKFSAYIKYLREKKDFTQEFVATKLEVTITTVANWENDRARPDYQMLSKISDLFDVGIDDLIIKLANDIEDNNIVLENQKFKYIDIFSSDFDSSSIEGLYFTNEEQEVFLTIAMHSHFRSSPASDLLFISKDLLSVNQILQKFKKFSLFGLNDSKKWFLTSRGSIILEIILKNKNLFNVYKLNLCDFIDVCKIFNIIDSATWTTKIMILKKAENNFVIERYINKNDKWNKYYLTKNEKWCEEDSYRYHYSEYKSYEEIYASTLNSDWFEITKSELTDPRYKIEKEAYEKKIKFYEEHKDEAELTKPADFEILYERKIALSDKGLAFYNKLTEVV